MMIKPAALFLCTVCAFTSSSAQQSWPKIILPTDDDVIARKHSWLQRLDDIILSCKEDDDTVDFRMEENQIPPSCKLAQTLVDVLDLEEEKKRKTIERYTGEQKDQSEFDNSTCIANETAAELHYSHFFLNYEEMKKAVLITDFPNLFVEDVQKERLAKCLVNFNTASTDFSDDKNVDSQMDVPPCIEMDDFISYTTNNNQSFFHNDGFWKEGKSQQTPLECTGSGSSNKFVPITEEDFCPYFNVSSDMDVPRYVANDYIKRINTTRRFLSRGNYEDYFLQATVVQPLEVIPFSEARCPASLHALYVAVKSTYDHDVHEEQNGMSQAPLLARIFKDDDRDLGPTISINFQSFPPVSKLYREDGWSGQYQHFMEVPLHYGSALFVPSGSTATIQGIQSHEWEETTMLRFCFVDASNFNELKQHLRIESIIDPVSSDVLLQLSDPSFDISITRDVPSTMNWNSAFQMHTQQHIDTTTEKGQPSAGRQLSRGGRRQRGTFANWQRGKAWDHKVIGLTLPIMDAPTILDYGRRNVTLSWLCPFAKKSGDTTDVGYIISWEGYSQNGATSPSSGNLTFIEPKEDTKGFADDDEFSVEFVTDKRSKSHGFPVRKLKGTVYGLNSQSNYTFKVAMLYGRENDMSMSSFSPASNTVTTESPSHPFPLPSPPIVLQPKDWDSFLGVGKKKNKFVPFFGSDATIIVLEMRAPHDDGGLDLERYDIMRAHVDSSGHKSGNWVVLQHGIEVLSDEKTPGGLVYIAVHDLLPGGSYEFKVAARNGIGQSGWSASSGIAMTYFSTGIHYRGRRLSSEGHGFVPPDGHHLYGVGANHINTPHDHIAISPILTLDDLQQTITRTGIPGPISAWTCYWSPRGFKVSAESARVTWGTNGELLNQDDVEYRIAVVDRGEGKPLSHLALAAQRAGALAVIIIDDERCDDFDQYCILGYSKADGDMWGELDLPSAWVDLKIPTMLVLSDTPLNQE